MVLETNVLPVTPCSRSNHGLQSVWFLLHNKQQTEVCATSMPSEGIEPPMTAQGRLIYSQVQCHSASSATLKLLVYSRCIFRCQKTKGASPSAHNAQKPPAPFCLTIELDLILGAGIRSRWIKPGAANNR